MCLNAEGLCVCITVTWSITSQWETQSITMPMSFVRHGTGRGRGGSTEWENEPKMNKLGKFVARRWRKESHRANINLIMLNRTEKSRKKTVRIVYYTLHRYTISHFSFFAYTPAADQGVHCFAASMRIFSNESHSKINQIQIYMCL